MKAIDIANAIIISHADNSYLTNMKLNKLVYFAYAEALQNGEKLFNDRIEAWTYGPVIPNIYKAFANNKKGRISSNCVSNTQLSREALDIANHIWDKYGFMTAVDIMNFSHRSDGAWKAVYKPGIYGLLINDEDIINSLDGKEDPVHEGTFAKAIEESSKRWSNVLNMLSNS